MQITFIDSISNSEALNFDNFFVGWPKKPSFSVLEILEKSTYFVVAKKENEAVGFITCLSDKLISAYISHLEVLPEYKNLGIGSQLVAKILAKVDNLYMVDLVCDPELNTYYSKFGFQSYNANIIRKYNNL